MVRAGRLSLTVVLFALLVLAPGATGARVPGVPPNGGTWMLLAAALALAAAVSLVPPIRSIGATVPVSLAVLLALKCALGIAAPQEGWRGVYFADARADSRVEFRSGPVVRAYRIDRRIDFERAGFGLHFLNDPARYNAHYSSLERQFEYPLRVDWTGYTWLEAASNVEIRATGAGRASVIVDGAHVFETDLEATPRASVVKLAAGRHEVHVAYDKPAGENASCQLSLFENGRPLVPTPDPAEAQAVGGLGPWRRASDGVVAGGALLLAFALLASYWPLTFAVSRLTQSRELLAAAATAAGFGALLLVYVRLRVVPLGLAAANLFSGDDPLAYEGYARNILFHGLLMPNGAQPGHGAAFYHYPLYSYVLAGAHVLFGEQFATVIFVNVACVASVLLLCWYLGWRRLPPWAAAIGIGLIGAFAVKHLMPYTFTAFCDNLFVSAVFVALVAGARAVERDAAGWWVVAGAAAALAAATRPSFLTYAGVFPLAVLLFGQAARVRRVQAAALFLAGFGAGLAPFALRNWIMARRLVLLVNSWIQIPYFLYPWYQKTPLRQVSGLPDALARAWHIFVTQPGMVIDIELRKLAFTFGFTQWGPENVGSHWDLALLFVLFAAALALRRIPRSLALVLCAFAVSHVAAMVLAAPWTYGYKTILPLHAAFLFGAVYLVVPRGAAVAVPGRPPGVSHVAGT